MGVYGYGEYVFVGLFLWDFCFWVYLFGVCMDFVFFFIF